MSNWEPGDMALCVKQGPWLATFEDGRIELGNGPRAGQFLTVREVGVGMTSPCALKFSDFPDIPTERGAFVGFESYCFVKVTPPADMIAEERIFEVTA